MSLYACVPAGFRYSKARWIVFAAGHIPGGLKAKPRFRGVRGGIRKGIPDDLKTLLFDPQTAGGLLVSIAPEASLDLVHALHAANVESRRNR